MRSFLLYIFKRALYVAMAQRLVLVDKNLLLVSCFSQLYHCILNFGLAKPLTLENVVDYFVYFPSYVLVIHI